MVNGISTFDHGDTLVEDVAIQGNSAYLHGDEIIRIVDVSHLESPAHISVYDTQRYTIRTLKVEGDFLYFSEWGYEQRHGLVVDISDSENPTEVAYYEHLRFYNFAVSGDYVYILFCICIFIQDGIVG